MKDNEKIILPVNLAIASRCIEIPKLELYLPNIYDTEEYSENACQFFKQTAKIKNYTYQYVIEEIENIEQSTMISRKYKVQVENKAVVNFTLLLLSETENETKLLLEYEIDLLQNNLVTRSLIKTGNSVIRKKYLPQLIKNMITYAKSL